MKKVYVQLRIFIFMNIFSLFLLLVGLFAKTTDGSEIYCIYVSAGFTLLSLLMLINKIYYDDYEIKISYINMKKTIKYRDIKEVFIEFEPFIGEKVIINLGERFFLSNIILSIFVAKVGSLCC